MNGMEHDSQQFSGNGGNPSMYYHDDGPKGLSKKILKPIRQEKIVKVPVTEYVEKIIEREEIKYVNKYVDVIKPIITYKTKHIPKPIYLDKIKYETKILEKEKIIHIPKIEYKNKIVDVPVYVHREKIIEKKIPMIIERVIPILKIRKEEKNVVLDSYGIPEICEMRRREKGSRSYRKYSVPAREVSLRRNSIQMRSVRIPNDTVAEEGSENVKTFRLQEEENEELNFSMEREVEENRYRQKNKMNSNSNFEGESVEGAEEVVQKAVTKYHDYQTGENEMHSFHENMQTEMHRSEMEKSGQESDNIRMPESNQGSGGMNRTYNTLGISIHLPNRDRSFSEFADNKSMNLFDKSFENQSQMNMQNAGSYQKQSGYLEHKINAENKAISEQIIREQAMMSDPKLYSSFPMNGNYQNNQLNFMQQQTEMEANFGPNPSHMQVSYENYRSEHNSHASMLPSKQSIRPSYANANGQSMITVRPATIVEYKQKAKAPRVGICNFLNKCCGGQE